MSDGAPEMTDRENIQELLSLLAGLVEAAEGLAAGAERDAALAQIRDFHCRLTGFLTRSALSRSNPLESAGTRVQAVGKAKLGATNLRIPFARRWGSPANGLPVNISAGVSLRK
jgi:hypothetical protein